MTRDIYRPLLELIGQAEGTAPPRGRGYNETLGYGAYTGGPVTLVTMSLDQVDALQMRMLRHPDNKLNSSAVGLYQIVRTTMRRIREARPDRYPGTRKYDADCQDEMACYLLGVRGIDRYIAGGMGEDAMVDALAKEWASFPATGGKGHYDGQRTGTTLAQVRAALQAVRARAAGAPASSPRPQPDDPGVAEAPPREEPVSRSKRFWTWLTTGAGGAGLLTGVAGLDPWLQRGLGLLLIGLAVYAIFTMRQVRRKVGLAE